MKEYTISSIELGMSESFCVTVSDEMLMGFRNISGDINPLHNDEEFAKTAGYKSRVVFGMLCASLFSTLAGVYLPGKYCLLHELTTKFKKPVFVGDTLTVFGTVTEKSAALRRITVSAKIVNQDGVLVNKASIKAGILK
ncbi:MAG: MaoC family dehydratase [Oscillospiraceae bacterium]